MASSKRTYDIIASIGYNCGCSGLLRRNKLQYASYPMDWNGLSAFKERVKLICNDFRDFMNIEDLRPVQKKSDSEISDMYCDPYYNIKDNNYFLHDFPINVPLNESYDSVKDKYDRRIKRFYHRISKAKKVLFVWFCQYFYLKDDEILEAQQNLAQKFPNQQIDLLIIENDREATTIKEEFLSKNITRVRYNVYTGQATNLLSKEMGNLQLGEQVFSHYKLNTPWWFKPALKLLHCIPGRSLRKKLRKKIYNL